MNNVAINAEYVNINGLKCRISHRTTKPGKAPELWFKQRIITPCRKIRSGEYEGKFIKAEMRFDDECGNGHNSFAITGEISCSTSFADRYFVAGGCLHDEIAEHFPELAHLIKWHLCSTDSPMHYVENTVYHAGDRDHYGRRKGEVSSTETRLKFTGSPITHGVKSELSAFIRAHNYGFSAANISDLDIVAVPCEDNKKGGYQFAPKYRFSGMPVGKWYQAPFDSAARAAEWRDALLQGYEWVTIPTAYSEGKERDFDAARSCGVWPDATDEQLSAEPEALKAALLERLPRLIREMRNDIEGAGFKWSADNAEAAQ